MTFDDVGDPDGTPVVYLHGGGDSRLSRHPGRLDRRRARRTATRARPLRPGRTRPVAAPLGGGSRCRGRCDRFGVVGWSAGGPHALALAAVAPDRVGRVALVGSMPPPDGVDELPGDVRR